MNSQIVPVYLLAGGLSSRFGSDKALAEISHRPLILHQADLLRPFASSLKVIADQAGKYQALGLETLADDWPQAGPMGGLQRTLQDVVEDWFLLASVDVWAVRPEQIINLLSADRAGQQAIAYRHDKWQPLWALYHRSLLSDVNHRLAQNQGALWRLLADVNALALDGSGLSWIQINRPVDLERANRLIPGQDGQFGP